MLTMGGLLPTGVLDKSLLLRTRQSPGQFLFNTKLAPLHTGQRTFWFLTELTKVHVPLGFSSEPTFSQGISWGLDLHILFRALWPLSQPVLRFLFLVFLEEEGFVEKVGSKHW